MDEYRWKGKRQTYSYQMTVLVLDGGHRSSLAIVRSLGQRGVDVHVGEHYSRSLSTFSKYCTDEVVYENPKSNGRDFIRDLNEILENSSYEMVISATEVTTYPLSYYKDELPDSVIVPFPEWETMVQVADKQLTFDRAKTIGIPIPETYSPSTRDEVREIASDLEYPVVIKPQSKITWIDNRPTTLRVTSKNYANNLNDLFTTYDEIVDKVGEPPLIQEYIPGEGYGVELLRYNGEIQTTFMHKRLREYPITGGASTYRKSVYDEKLLEPAITLLDGLDWEGVAMVEFRLDERDGRPKLMEINGRFWGSLPLAIAAGADFPFDLYTVAKGGSVSPSGYDTEVYSRWLFPGDLLWLASSLRNNSGRISTITEFLGSTRSNYDVLSLDDPYPTIGVTRKLLKQSAKLLKGEKTLSGEDRS